MSDEFQEVLEKVELLLCEMRELRSGGPHFRIIHRFRVEGSDCAPGEEIATVYLVHRSREYFVPLSLALRLLFDYLARYPHLPQSAAQIVAGMKADLFCRKHGANAGVRLRRAIGRSSLKEYVNRVRHGLNFALQEANVGIDGRRVLVSEPTVMNEVGYRLKASFEWCHLADVCQEESEE